MKSVYVLLGLVAAASAFQAPMMATRAVAKPAPKKAAPAPKKVVAKAAPAPKPAAVPVVSTSKYPSFKSSFKIKGISGGGNKAPPVNWVVPDFSDPKLQIKRDPAVYAEAAKKRGQKGVEFVIDDGLTELERKQRKVTPAFLTGSAKSQADKTAIRSDLAVSADDYFGLGPDRFQLLFLTVFGLFTLVGCLSGSIKL